MGEPTNLDSSLQEAIDDSANKAAQKEGQKVREESSTRRRHYLEILGLLAAVVTVVAFFGVRTMIDNAVKDAINNTTLKKINERAEEIRKSLEEKNSKAEEFLQDITEAANKAEEEKRIFQEELAGPGIETHRYLLNLPQKAGTYSYETSLRKTKFEAAIVSSWRLSGCLYSDAADIFMDNSKETWRIRVTKPPRCKILDVRIVYVPAAMVKKAYSRVTLNPIR